MNYPDDNLRRILFIDIETASQHKDFEELSEPMKFHWHKKMRRQVSTEDYPLFEEEFAALYHDKAAIYAEFAKVICISVGFLYDELGKLHFKVKSFYGENEKEILTEFHDLLNQYYFDRHNQFLCGHNIKEFDVPFLCRRSRVNHLPLPNLLNITGFKPWQVHHLLDTLEMWKYGDYKHYTSLDLLCSVLEVPTSKTEMDGSLVSSAFWEGRLSDIVTYCQRDVIATARVYLKCIGGDTFDDLCTNYVD